MGAGLLVDPNEFANANHIAMQLGSEVRRLASVVAHVAQLVSRRVQPFLVFQATIPLVRLLQLIVVSVSSSPNLLAAPLVEHA